MFCLTTEMVILKRSRGVFGRRSLQIPSEDSQGTGRTRFSLLNVFSIILWSISLTIDLCQDEYHRRKLIVVQLQHTWTNLKNTRDSCSGHQPTRLHRRVWVENTFLVTKVHFQYSDAWFFGVKSHGLAKTEGEMSQKHIPGNGRSVHQCWLIWRWSDLNIFKIGSASKKHQNS